MITKSYCVSAMKRDQIVAIGRQMENNYRQISFSLSDFTEEIDTVMLVHQRYTDVAPYIVTQATGENVLTWTITNTDTAYAGYGEAELRVTFTNGLAKSVVFRTLVVRSITADMTIPEPLQSWYDAMIDYIDEHSVSPEQIEQAVADYLDAHPVQAPVTSVNGEIGAVVLTASDVGALPDTYTAPVASVNGKTGSVVLTASDVNALPSSTSIPSKTSELTNDSGFLTSAVTSFNGQTGSVTYTAPVQSVDGKTGTVSVLPTGGTTGQVLTKTSNTNYAVQWQTVQSGGAVDSVNGQTGVVVLDADDVGALPDTYVAPVQSVNGQTGAVTVTVPTKTSDLTNDSGFITSAPVSSVDGKTGAVTVIPTGGTTGQVLAKASNTDRDVEWVNQSGGGGDTWRVIADITTTEEVLSINITQDSNGNSFSLKEFRVFASVPKCTQASNGQWGVNSYWMDSSGGFNTGSGRHGSFAIKLNPDNTATSMFEQFGIGGYNTTNFSTINGGFYDGRLIEARSFPNGFTAIRLRQSNTSYTLPVGTHIYVYGVDL